MSEDWRQEGNKHFKSATGDLGPAVREGRLQKAVAAYYKAYNTAVTPNERYTICSLQLKNVHVPI